MAAIMDCCHEAVRRSGRNRKALARKGLIVRHRSLSGVFTLLLMAIASCSSSQSLVMKPSQTPLPVPSFTSLPTWTPTVIPVVGPVPQNCPLSQPQLHSISPNLITVIGKTPVWAGWPGGTLVANLGISSEYVAPYGWEITKLIWEVGPNYTQPITLMGTEVHDHTPLLFQIDGNAPTTHAVLDPAHPGHPVSVVGDNWSEWGSYLIVPKAGCFTMVVSWPQGQWQFTLAAGAMPS